MITIFNRKELLMTFDIQKQGVVRRMLVENGIKYTVDVVNLPGSFSKDRRRCREVRRKN